MALPEDNSNTSDDTTDSEVAPPPDTNDAGGRPVLPDSEDTTSVAGSDPDHSADDPAVAGDEAADPVEESESPDPDVAEGEADADVEETPSPDAAVAGGDAVGPVEEAPSPDPAVAGDDSDEAHDVASDDVDGPEPVVVPAHDLDGPGHDNVPRADEVLMPDITAPIDPQEPGTDTHTGHDHQPDATAGRTDRDGPSSKAPILIGVVLLVLAGLAVAIFLLAGGSGDPAYTVYQDSVSRDQLQERLDGLVDEELLTVVGDIENASPEQKGQLARPISTLITEDVMTKAAADEELAVTEEDIDDQITEIVDQSFGGDREAFDQAIEERGATLTEVRTQFRTALLAEALIETDESPDPADDAAVQEFYDAQFAEPVVAHVLTETEEQAQQARDRIEGGEEFGTVAQEVSIDPGSGQQGGRLGPLVEGQFVAEFEAAANELAIGELSQPIETEFGYHIITLEAPPELDEVRDAIVQQLEQNDQAEKFAALGERLDEEAEVTVDPAFGNWTGLAEGGLVVEELSPPAGAPEDAPTE
ncbi:hypothetical protein BH24ACT15_BH24ACT15_29420 [soil metagenome]